MRSSDAGSSRSEEEEEEENREQDDSNPRPVGSRSAKSLKKQEEEETKNPNYNDSDSSSSNNRNKYTDQQQAELLRKLDSIKDHLLLRGGGNNNNANVVSGHGHGHGPSSYYNPYPEPYPYGMMYPNHAPAYGFMRPQNWYPPPPPPPQAHHHYPRPPPSPYPYQGQYVDIGADILDPHLQQEPRFFPVTPSRHSDIPYSPRHTRYPSEIDSEFGATGGGRGGGYVQKPYVSSSVTDSRRCHPLAGGAPFIACHNCFELLYLPKKFANEQKMQCGACSEVFSFKIVDKKLLFSSSDITETTNPVSVEVKEEESRKPRETKTVPPVVSVSEEQSDDEERSSVSSEPRVAKSVRRRVKDNAKPPPPPPPENSNLLELFEYSNVNRAALTYGMAQLGYNKQQSYKKQDSLKPESVVVADTETDVSYNGYYNNTEETEEEDSRISNKEEKNNKARNRKESSNESEYSFSEEVNELEVWVNGHLIPEELVISAEKQSGPVQAGNYWYDYRAGFWGVMGNPCLGIIPPFIEEFSRPMPDNCGAGNTGVFVNGRELHERDLELLTSRGLPREKNRSYIVDISGRVLDGDSGEELKCLGKLAPTIEKVKHGFGMRVPRSLSLIKM